MSKPCPECLELHRRGFDDAICAIEHAMAINTFYVRFVVEKFGYEQAKEVARMAEEFAKEIIAATQN